MTYRTAQVTSLKSKVATIGLVSALSFGTLLTAVSADLIPAFAQVQQTTKGRQLTITPPSLPLSVKPGDTAEGTVGLINDSNEDLDMEISVFDVIVQDDLGTPEILPGGTIENNKYSASSWLGVSTPRFVAKAHQRTDIRYFYQVPGNAGPGGHYAAIVFRPKPFTAAAGTGAAINMQLSTLVYFDVAGPIKESASVKSFTAPGLSEYGPVKLKALVKNDGDTHIKPVGTFSVKNMMGKVIATKEIPAGNIFPGGIARAYEQAVGKKWMFGRYTATFMASYGRSNNLPLVASVAFWVFPWKIALLILVILIAAILGYIAMKRNKHGHNTPEAQPQQPQTPPAPQQ